MRQCGSVCQWGHEEWALQLGAWAPLLQAGLVDKEEEEDSGHTHLQLALHDLAFPIP